MRLFRIFLVITMTSLISGMLYSAERKAGAKGRSSAPQRQELVDAQNERRLSCCERIMQGIGCGTIAILVISFGYNVVKILNESTAKEQARLTTICDNPASVNGFTLESELPVPQMGRSEKDLDCECWNLHFVTCGEHSKSSVLSTKFLEYEYCAPRKHEPIPLLHDSERGALHNRAQQYAKANSKHVLYWQNVGCKAVPFNF